MSDDDDDSTPAAVRKVTAPLEPHVHGFRCSRGHLWLGAQECVELNVVLAEVGLGFVPVPSTVEPSASASTTSNRRPQRQAAIRRSRESESPERWRKRKRDSSTSPRRTRNGPNGQQVRSTPVRSLRRRGEPLEGKWEEVCLEVTEALERHPCARHFLVPPENGETALFNSLDHVACPMDFQTIRQKLHGDMYRHPFRWQHDVRTIFANVFMTATAGTPVFTDTEILAEYFEELCRKKEGVNPYAVFKPQDQPQSTTVQPSQQDQLPPPSNSFIPPPTPAVYRPPQPPQPQQAESGLITLPAEQLRALLQRAAEGDKAVLGNIAPSQQSAIFPPLPISGGTGASTTTLPPSPLPAAPPPPPMSLALGNERAFNSVQRRGILSQFRELDVHLRKALLELVREELGIDPVAAAKDPDFLLDVDLLPAMRQKWCLLYLKNLVIFQRDKVRAGLRPLTAAAVAEQEKSQTQSPPTSTSLPQQPFVCAPLQPNWATPGGVMMPTEMFTTGKLGMGKTVAKIEESSEDSSEAPDDDEDDDDVNSSTEELMSPSEALRTEMPAGIPHGVAVESAWRGWKSREIQDQMQSRMYAASDAENNRDVLDVERAAEQADAEI